MSASDPIEPLAAAVAEALRCDALAALRVLDTPPEPAFDDVVWLASHLCDTPIALVSLVDHERQWFKARVGLDVTEAPRKAAFCAHALGSDDVLLVEDATQDLRFRDNPLVTGEPHVRFYAGAPLIGAQGHRFGTLCVIDTKPRRLEAPQLEGLVRLARRASENLETRRERLEAQSRESTLQLLLEAMPDAVVTCDRHGSLQEFNRAAREWHGVDPRAMVPESWAVHFGLYDETDTRLLSADEIPLRRAFRGERVREVAIVIRTPGQAPRKVLCNADPLLGGHGEVIGAVCVMHDVTRLAQVLDDVTIESQRFSGAFTAAAQGMALVSLDGRFVEVNDALCAMFGHTPEEMRELDFQRLTHPDDLGGDIALVDDLLKGRRTTYQLHKRYFHRDGRTLYAHLSVSLVRDARSEPLHFVAQIQDETQRQLAERRVQASEERLRTIADNVPALIGHVDTGLRYRFVNKPYADWFGRRPEDIIGKPMREVLRPEHFEALRPKLERVLGGETLSFHMDVVGQAGMLRHMHANYVPDRDGDAVQGFHLMIHDVTAQTQLARVLEERAMTDELTGLPNRAAWNAELERAVARARRNRAPMVAMFLDLNGFKAINDTLGHAAGDTLLCEFASRLRGALRGNDYAARLSGDEFVVLLDGIEPSPPTLAEVAARVHGSMARPLTIDGREVRLSASIGFAVQAGSALDPHALVRAADEAMYQAKRTGAPFSVVNC